MALQVYASGEAIKRALADGSETLKKPGKDTSEQNLRFCVNRLLILEARVFSSGWG